MYKISKQLAVISLLAAMASAQSIPVGSDNANIMGFTDASTRGQRAIESKFDQTLNADELRGWLKRLSARPNNIGSPHNRENADFLLGLFKSWGFDAHLEQFDVLFPTPKTRLVEVVSPEKFTLKLNEPEVKNDSTSGQQTEQLPTYNAYSIDGDVTAPVVYVNYGTPGDYEELAKRGIDVKGKIVISRYGGAWRGIKPKVAAEHGAVGCIIYSDPKNDGYYQGDVYPNGAWRSDEGVQRGSVMDMPLYPGDPLTPGYGATPGAKRLDLKAAETLTKIPVLPISYADALPIIRNLDGRVVPEAWRGALPVTYHFGGSSPTVHMKLAFNWGTTSIFNVIAKMPGSEKPDEWIIRGNHRDGWVNGAEDPLSGLIALLAEAKGVGQLAKDGWKPKRTIVYAAWDGEEEGLLGSTEWVEAHAEELSKKAAVYINTDSNGRGFFDAGGSHSLEKFINGVAKDVPDPQVKMSVWERSRAGEMAGSSAAQRTEIMKQSDSPIEALGSGSDFTPFLQHLGIASLNIGFGGENSGGSYHSIYDSFDHFVRFGDPKFEYGIALAKVGGRATIRLADADVLPFEFTNQAATFAKYVKELGDLTTELRTSTASMNELIDNGMLRAAADPTEKWVLPAKKDVVPEIDISALTKSVERLTAAAELLSKAKPLGDLTKAQRNELDELFIRSERLLTNETGLPRRGWFRHQIYAPGFYTGYGVKTMPGVREAIEQRDWSEARSQVGVIAASIDGLAAEIERVAKDVAK